MKEVEDRTNLSSVSIKSMSFSDLYAMYLFVSGDGNNRGFGMTSPGAKKIVREKQKEIEEELYARTYGSNPFEEHKVVFEGVKPEDIDLDRFVVAKDKVEEPEDTKPETFVVADAPEREG